jgi:two-component system, cell cycle sensor histidine kinase and response regulator CckA
VLEAGSGIQALVVAQGHAAKIDVVVADIVMPLMNGPEMVEKLREKGHDFVTIFMSGYSEGPALDLATIGGIFLQKPFSTEMLAEKIQEALNRNTKAASTSSNG